MGRFLGCFLSDLIYIRRSDDVTTTIHVYELIRDLRTFNFDIKYIADHHCVPADLPLQSVSIFGLAIRRPLLLLLIAVLTLESGSKGLLRASLILYHLVTSNLNNA